jgi:hypothetical protein
MKHRTFVPKCSSLFRGDFCDFEQGDEIPSILSFLSVCRENIDISHLTLYNATACFLLGHFEDHAGPC